MLFHYGIKHSDFRTKIILELKKKIIYLDKYVMEC